MTDREAMQAIMQVLGPEPVCQCMGCAWETHEALRLLREQGIEYVRRHQVTAACLHGECPVCEARKARLTAAQHDRVAEERGNAVVEPRYPTPDALRKRLAQELNTLKTEAWDWARKLDDPRRRSSNGAFLTIGELGEIVSCLRALYWYGREVYEDEGRDRGPQETGG